jgi:predicted O-methyltransferase YrrM
VTRDPEALWSRVEQFLIAQLLPPDPVLDAALAASAAADLPNIQISPVEAQFLQLVAKAMGARRILEVGTLGGYSTIWLARALPPSGTLVTLEIDPKHAAVASANVARAGLSGMVDIRVGPALALLPAPAQGNAVPFDFVFIDADKEHNAEYFEWALRLSRPGGLIVVDNVIREGAILSPRSKDAAVQGVRRFFERVRAEPRVRATALQTVGSKGYDGMAFLLVQS